VFPHKDLESLRYFLGLKGKIEKRNIFVSNKIFTEHFFEAGLLGCRVVDTLMEINVKLPRQAEDLDNLGKY